MDYSTEEMLDIHDRVTRLETTMDKAVSPCLERIETRLHSIERHVWIGVGLIAAIQVAIQFLV